MHAETLFVLQLISFKSTERPVHHSLKLIPTRRCPMLTRAKPYSRGRLLSPPPIRRKADADFTIDSSNVLDIGWGLGLTASGGGGSFVDGMNLIQNMVDDGFVSLTAKAITNAVANEASVIAGGMGEPSAIGGTLVQFVDSCLAAIDALKTALAIQDPITGILPIEAGPVNAILALYICYKSGGSYTLFDCDGGGRAVPSLSNLLYDFEGVAFSPSAQASLDGSKTQVDTFWVSGSDAELGLREAISEYGGAIGLAAWFQPGEKLAGATLNTDTFRTAATTGGYIRSYKSNPGELLAYLKSIAGINPQFEGLTVRTTFNERKSLDNAAGYDKGYFAFGRDGTYEYRLYYLNENMFIGKFLMTDETFVEYVATAPSVISMFISDPEPPPELTEADDTVKAGDYIPYNTGDLANIDRLVGQDMIVCVSPPTPILYEPKKVDTFLTVLNSYFNNPDDPAPWFPFTIADIFPKNGIPTPTPTKKR
jgi:DUF917 family protein